MKVTDFIKRERNAPTSMRQISAQFAGLSTCLTQLSPFVWGIESVHTSRKAAISVEQVVTITTSCVSTLSELEEVLGSFQLDQDMTTSSRLRWERHEEKIENILVRVRASKSSLNLISTIFIWQQLFSASLNDIKTSMGNLEVAVQGIVAYSDDVSQRLARIETPNAEPSRNAFNN